MLFRSDHQVPAEDHGEEPHGEAAFDGPGDGGSGDEDFVGKWNEAVRIVGKQR